MSPVVIISCIVGYFLVLLFIAWYTGRNANSEGYFLGNKASPWYAVAFGMIGDSLSGVTFISVPGRVQAEEFTYMQVVFGYFIGYFVISYVLLPLYYRMQLTSIYSYLGTRLGEWSQKTGSFYFILSRLLGAAGRLFLAAGVLQIFVFDQLGINFYVTVASIIVLMLFYTYRGGIKTLVWTDVFQSVFLLLGVILSIAAISKEMGMGFFEMEKTVFQGEMSDVFVFDWKSPSYFLKHILGGAFLTIVMTGLDQNMMQKNLSLRTLKEAQTNINSFSFIVLIVNVFFLSLGALLFMYMAKNNISIPVDPVSGNPSTDRIFPHLALNYLGIFAGLAFITGLTAATFSSADSVLTTLTTSFYIDLLGKKESEDKKDKTIRHIIHIGFGVLLLLVIVSFGLFDVGKGVINLILKIAGYTYGPLLGLFAFGIFTKKAVNDKLVPLICLLSPIITYILNENAVKWFNGYQFGFEILIVNGILTFIGLQLVSRKEDQAGLKEV